MQLIPWIIGGAIVLMTGGGIKLAGSGVEDAGEGVNDASNGTLKIAAAAALAYVVYKKVK